ncbi:hypothetical protein FKG94_03200 [Exilibacterium tricleocarpae]|uniref:Dephospho-CoA kinase n=1 Tax=Exilibacterium tricleocarpae TaxID=2591008 RepID=A0A545U6W2_9GAMM|nr:hypothetical protein [Exilibacterium tricleocarpae]TQV85210.1 hypothetical protein FKG94_03200 [Exilibacterium tricleocarpae]
MAVTETNILIGVSGVSGTGRHGAAMYLARHLELRPHAIALPILRCCAATINMDFEIFKNLEKDQTIGMLGNRTKRQFLRDVGKFYREQVDVFFLLRQLEHRIQCEEASNNLFNGNLVTDVKLDTEAEWVRFNGGQVIHIKQDKAPADFDVIDLGVEVDRADIVIQNNGTVEQLHKKLDSVIQLIRTNSGLPVT